MIAVVVKCNVVNEMLLLRFCYCYECGCCEMQCCQLNVIVAEVLLLVFFL